MRWQVIIVPTHPKYKMLGIKSKGLRYGLEHREKEAQLLSLSIQGSNYGQPTMGKEEDKLEKVALFYLGGLQTSLCLFKKALFFVLGETLGGTHMDGHTHSSLATNLP